MDMFLEYAKAFLVGGAICAVGQILVDKTKLKEGSEHLLEEPYPEVPAGELT